MPSLSHLSSTNGGIGSRYTLKISNLPPHYNDMAIISAFKQLMAPISKQAHFKKIIFKRTRSGQAFLFVKFPAQNHMNAAYSNIHNQSMGGQLLSVQFADDDPLGATHTLSAKRSATLFRSGFMVQDLQNGSERMTTIVPMHTDARTHALSPNLSPQDAIAAEEGDVAMRDNIQTPIHKEHQTRTNDASQQTPIQAEESVTAKCMKQTKVSVRDGDYTIHINGGNDCKATRDASGCRTEKHSAKRTQIADQNAGDVEVTKTATQDDVDIETLNSGRRDVMCNAAHINNGDSCNNNVETDEICKVRINNGITDDAVPMSRKPKSKLKCRLFIKNINRNIGDNQLKTKFEKFGAVSSAKIIRDPATNASKGVGFVTFKSSKASKRAIQSMHNASWYGQKLCVAYVSDPSCIDSSAVPSIPNPVPKRRIIPTDPRIKRKEPQKALQSVPPVFVPPIHFPVTVPSKPPPPPPRPTVPVPVPPVASRKPSIVHHFSSKPIMQTVIKPPAPPHCKQVHFSVNHHPHAIQANASKPKTNPNQNKAGASSSCHPYISPIPRVPNHATPLYTNPPSKSLHFGQRFMPLVIPGNVSATAIKQPPIISGSLTKFLSQRISGAQTTKPVAPPPSNTEWQHAILLGNLPAYPSNEYHKLRFKIEQNSDTPVTAMHVLKKPIASSANASDVFTCCCIFGSQDEMKHAFTKLNGCMVENQRVICDAASKYVHQLKGIFAPTLTPTCINDHNNNTESETQLKALSVSDSSPQRTFSPPSSTSNSTHSTQQSPHDRHKERVTRRDRSKGRHRYESYDDYAYYDHKPSRARDQYYKRYRDRHEREERQHKRDRDRHATIKYSGFQQRTRRHRPSSFSRSVSRSRSRTRSPSVHAFRAKTKRQRRKSRCVVISCSASDDTNGLKPSDIATVVGGSIARIIKREAPVHDVEKTQLGATCQFYFYIRFLSSVCAHDCVEKLKQGYNLRGCLLMVQSLDEAVWNTFFAATDCSLRDKKKVFK